MKKHVTRIMMLFAMMAFALSATGCNAVMEEARWYFQNVKEKGLYTASLEFTEHALVIGGATAVAAPEIGLIMGMYAVKDASNMNAAEAIVTVGNVAGFAAGTALILAPAAAISAVGLASQGLPDNYDGTLFSVLHDTIKETLNANIGARCHRDYDCVGSVCVEGHCTAPQTVTDCTALGSEYANYRNRCLKYNGITPSPDIPSCVLDIDCGNGICQNGQCAPQIACKEKTDCPLDNHACINGQCLIYNECAIDKDCNDKQDGTHYCNAALECVKEIECVTNSDCSGNAICYQDVCIECRFDSECSNGQVCYNGMCK